MKKLLVVIFTIIYMVLIIHCKKIVEPVPSTNIERYFSLYFYVDHVGYNHSPFINVKFWTTDISRIPLVTINGEIMELFEPSYDGILEGSIYSLQFSDTVNYIVAEAGKTTTGNIIIPTDPYDMLCNGIPFDEDDIIYITSSNSYDFSWSCNIYDYFILYWQTGYTEKGNITSDKNISYNDDGSDFNRFIIISHKGASLMSGSKPNAIGDYGKGYVFAESEYNYYYLEIETNQKFQSFNISKEIKIKNYRRKFIDLISKKDKI